MKKLLFLALLLPNLLKAQHPACFFDEYRKNIKASFQVAPFSNRVTEDSTTVLKIPVVIHILHLNNPIGSSNNPTSASIKETLDYLNSTYRSVWPQYADTLHGGVNLRIEFVLATKDTLGNPFDGIDRVSAVNYPEYVQFGRVIGTNILLNTMWNKFRYMNIWLLHMLEGGREGFGIAPEPANAPIFNIDGVVLLASAFRPGYPIVVHEAGHYLGLDHTWASVTGIGCPANNNCETDGDMICDTEPHIVSASCALIGTINPCTGLPYGNTLRNFMSYSELTCWDRFTRLQRKRMRETILSLRPGIPGNDATVITPVDLKKLNNFTITPNPNYGNFTINIKAPLIAPYVISIVSTSGQVVYKKNVTDLSQLTIPVSIHPSGRGMYFVELQDKSAKLSRAFFLR